VHDPARFERECSLHAGKHSGHDALVRTAALLVLVACAAPEEAPQGDEQPADGEQIMLPDGKADGGTWTSIGLGVIYQRQNTGNAILIAYGGYTARLVDSAAWASELVDARLGAQDVGHVYAVKGPADAAYAAREIQNSKLRAHLPASDAKIYIVAHSSGAFVANELLQQLQSKNATDTLARIAYADLDGGTSGLTQSILDALGGVTFVSARDPAVGRSRNAAFMEQQAQAFGVEHTEVVVASTGCISTWCLHDVVITHRPHNPNSYDLARDYADFVNRPVMTEYFDAFD
jgi:hypothetical protein